MEEGWRMDGGVGRERYEGGVVVGRESVGEEVGKRGGRGGVFHGMAWIRGCRFVLSAVAGI